ncbi:hypothetical protein [Effusibacillus dendaii]|uniref:aconitate hydratase n=1 Tax=Effusibacillus dendaii TaxID=2743772 RepID=A0A7I8DDR7_9BACL|nr:hypothetical protein [Effusibacillus dendaii]BCJ86966.1 hypothetical protein skT53_19510 [Effusibacillus dendaii]
MGKNLTQKIPGAHLVSGEMEAGKEIAIRIDQTLTQDATGTMAYLQFEAMGVPKVKTELSVSYVDHNMLQSGFENADDHRFLQTIAAKQASIFQDLATGIVIRCIWNGLPNRAKRCSASIPTHPLPAVWV